MAKMKQAYLPYAGIGSRETPKAVMDEMTALATQLEQYGFTLRTGGATGADTAFLNGIQHPDRSVELYLPWQGYNDYESPWCKVPKASIVMASRFHPNWQACSQGTHKLHGRNCNIILGPDVMRPLPAEFVICYTKGGNARGGTGMAIAVADNNLIPVFDLGVGVDITLLNFENFFKERYTNALHTTG